MDDPLTEEKIKQHSIYILRSLANFRASEKQGKLIRQDLCVLGYTDFLSNLIVREKSNVTKEEYIKALVDVLDEGEVIQNSLIDYMKKDSKNLFL